MCGKLRHMKITDVSNEDLVDRFLVAHLEPFSSVAMRFYREELMRRLEIAEASARDK